jgi:hypothetical protein
VPWLCIGSALTRPTWSLPPSSAETHLPMSHPHADTDHRGEPAASEPTRPTRPARRQRRQKPPGSWHVPNCHRGRTGRQHKSSPRPPMRPTNRCHVPPAPRGQHSLVDEHRPDYRTTLNYQTPALTDSRTTHVTNRAHRGRATMHPSPGPTNSQTNRCHVPPRGARQRPGRPTRAGRRAPPAPGRVGPEARTPGGDLHGDPPADVMSQAAGHDQPPSPVTSPDHSHEPPEPPTNRPTHQAPATPTTGLPHSQTHEQPTSRPQVHRDAPPCTPPPAPALRCHVPSRVVPAGDRSSPSTADDCHVPTDYRTPRHGPYRH